ncbi:STE3-domain-containing protein [Dichomitus squalens]|uniref:STE3-domain-containing protein n=1 Tax=Dichomitus squalens TaxID=114155 RepID=A0A4V2K7H4_9APHY|nr:STE3-domain-containing protein [Dichomitus squalens]
MHADPTYPLLPVFAFLGFVIVLIPLPWHLQAWNAGTCVYMIWTSLACLVQFVNSILWKDTVLNLAPVWCDISTKFIIGAGVGIPASTLCINRRLYKITSVRTVSVTPDEKRRALIVDLCISIGLPVLVMILHYVVQGHRFNILQGVGCLPEIYNTPPAYPLVFMWPPLIGCVSFVYAFLTLLGFLKHRIQFSEVVSSNNAGMTISRYFRLMLLCLSEMVCTIPIGVYSIYINTAGVTLSPWISWANTHADFSRVLMIPAVIWRQNRSFLISVVMGQWVYIFAAFLFFALFGFADEAKRHYAMVFWWVMRWFGIHPKPKSEKMQFSKLSGISYGKPSPSSPDFHSLPPYSPPSAPYTPRKRPESLSPSLAGSFGDVDLERGLGHAKIPATQSEFSTEDAESVDGVIIISDECPASTPPTPVAPLRPVPPAAVPAYHRPFSPPPGAASDFLDLSSSIPRKASVGSISIIVHTETRTF